MIADTLPYPQEHWPDFPLVDGSAEIHGDAIGWHAGAWYGWLVTSKQMRKRQWATGRFDLKAFLPCYRGRAFLSTMWTDPASGLRIIHFLGRGKLAMTA